MIAVMEMQSVSGATPKQTSIIGHVRTRKPSVVLRFLFFLVNAFDSMQVVLLFSGGT